MLGRLKKIFLIMTICTLLFNTSFGKIPVSISELGSIVAYTPVVAITAAAATAVTPAATVGITTDITSREQLEKLFLNAYLNGSTKVSFKINRELANRTAPMAFVVDVLKNENIEFKYFNSYSILRDYRNNYSVTFHNNFSQKSISEMNKKVLAKVKQIVKSTIDTSMTDYQKELALHEYLLKNIKYDYSNYAKGKIPELDYTPYGALLRKVAVCQGYSEAMNLLLKEVGIQSIIVSGTAKGGNHAWNMVRVEGEWYQLDSTFNHPFINGIQTISHNYFNVTDAQLARDHSWDKKKYPKCTKIQFAYRDDIEKVDKSLMKSTGDINNLLKNGFQIGKKELSFKIMNKSFKGFDIYKLILNFNKNNLNEKYIAIIDHFNYKDNGSVTTYNLGLEYKAIDIQIVNLADYKNYLGDVDNSNVNSISIAAIGLKENEITDNYSASTWKLSYTSYNDIELIVIDLKRIR